MAAPSYDGRAVTRYRYVEYYIVVKNVFYVFYFSIKNMFLMFFYSVYVFFKNIYNILTWLMTFLFVNLFFFIR